MFPGERRIPMMPAIVNIEEIIIRNLLILTNPFFVEIILPRKIPATRKAKKGIIGEYASIKVPTIKVEKSNPFDRRIG